MLEYNLFLLIFSFYVLTGMFIFSSFHKHLLMTLLSLEYIMLNIFLMVILNVSWDSSMSFLILVFLIFAVVEGSVGLSVLVSIIRSHGSDMMKSMSMVW